MRYDSYTRNNQTHPTPPHQIHIFPKEHHTKQPLTKIYLMCIQPNNKYLTELAKLNPVLTAIGANDDLLLASALANVSHMKKLHRRKQRKQISLNADAVCGASIVPNGVSTDISRSFEMATS
eukprot:m.106953 g.106953  ORF g.106953 m.106953 type:complete len:122 (+) comp13906_c0_seq1:1509-1874(+)